jgi:hypothetical protein
MGTRVKLRINNMKDIKRPCEHAEKVVENLIPKRVSLKICCTRKRNMQKYLQKIERRVLRQKQLKLLQHHDSGNGSVNSAVRRHCSNRRITKVTHARHTFEINWDFRVDDMNGHNHVPYSTTKHICHVNSDSDIGRSSSLNCTYSQALFFPGCDFLKSVLKTDNCIFRQYADV